MLADAASFRAQDMAIFSSAEDAFSQPCVTQIAKMDRQIAKIISAGLAGLFMPAVRFVSVAS
jgi:hypothetical protein